MEGSRCPPDAMPRIFCAMKSGWLYLRHVCENILLKLLTEVQPAVSLEWGAACRHGFNACTGSGSQCSNIWRQMDGHSL